MLVGTRSDAVEEAFQNAVPGQNAARGSRPKPGGDACQHKRGPHKSPSDSSRVTVKAITPDNGRTQSKPEREEA